VQRELAEVEARFSQLRVVLSNLENYIPHFNKVLGQPGEHLSLQEVALRLNRMNVLVSASTDEPAHELRLKEVKLRDGRRFALLLVKCRREDLRPQRELWEEAVRGL
jgi:hypothetical protein